MFKVWKLYDLYHLKNHKADYNMERWSLYHCAFTIKKTTQISCVDWKLKSSLVYIYKRSTSIGEIDFREKIALKIIQTLFDIYYWTYFSIFRILIDHLAYCACYSNIYLQQLLKFFNLFDIYQGRPAPKNLR